ncbi:hypothetical protein ACS0TY_019632 [Phlomoides rotata]
MNLYNLVHFLTLAIGEATTDAELDPSALDQAKAMGHILATTKDQLYDLSFNSKKVEGHASIQ